MNDFDFLIGSWTVVNRRLRVLFAGSDDWDAFPGTSTIQSAFEGGASIDEIIFPTKGFRGLTVRLFDVDRKQWAIYWSNSQRGVLDPPVFGTFAGGRGDFYGEDFHEGKPVRVHYIWSGADSGRPRWEQEFSADGGQTWESNWTMDFTRA